MNKLLKLALDNLKYNEWIGLWEYTIKNEFKWQFIYKDEEVIWVIADWVIYINWFFKRTAFENALFKYDYCLIEFLDRKFDHQKEKIMNLESEKTRLEVKNMELEKKIQDKVVESTINDLFPEEEK